MIDDEYLSKSLDKILDGSLRIEDFAKKIKNKVGIISDEDITELNKKCSQYRMGLISKDDVIKSVKKIINDSNGDTNTLGTNIGNTEISTPKGSNTTTNSTLSNGVDNNTVYETDTDFFATIADNCSAISSGIESAKITANGPMAKYAGETIAAAAGVSAIGSVLNNFKSLILEIVSNASMIDADYNNDNKSWDDIKIDVLSNRNGMRLADENFFISQGYKVENGVVTIDNYKYDINKKTLYYDGTSVKVEYYIPNSHPDISKANTITVLAQSAGKSISSDKSYGDLKSYKTNSIIIVPVKDGNAQLSYVHNNMTEKVIESTKFAKVFAKQKSGCRNYISGCSSGGGSAFKIGASDIYDGVIPINTTPMIPGVGGGYAVDRITEEELVAYAKSGKPILFINSDGDPNVENVVMALKKIRSEYPGINVHWASNSRNSKAAGYIDSDCWNSFATNTTPDGTKNNISDKTHEYYQHGAFHGMLFDILNSGLVDGNEYNNGKTFEWN